MVMIEQSSTTRSLARELVGTWELVSRIDLTTTGERHPEPTLGEDPIALLYYDRSGHFAAQFMKRDRTTSRVPEAETAVAGAGAPNNSRAQAGYDAYFGTYTVDDARGMVTQRLLGALSAENVGQLLTRAMTVEGETLTITLQTSAAGGEPVTRTLVWRRVG
jgi:Lipocalin-like domain